jgi:hypothetical protein
LGSHDLSGMHEKKKDVPRAVRLSEIESSKERLKNA